MNIFHALFQKYRDWQAERAMWRQFEKDSVEVLKMPGILEAMKAGADAERRRQECLSLLK